LTNNFIFNTGHFAFQILAYDTRREILQRLKAKNGFLIEPDETHATNGYFVQVSTFKYRFYFGLMTEEYTFLPQIIYHPNPDDCWILYESSLVLLSLSEKKCIKYCTLPCLYWTAFYKNNLLIVVHELGASCFDLNAVQMWELSGSDKLNDFEIMDKEIICIFDDGSKKAHTI
jgi:hypothetical protein